MNVWAGYQQRPRDGVDRRKTAKIVLLLFEIGSIPAQNCLKMSCSLKPTVVTIATNIPYRVGKQDLFLAFYYSIGYSPYRLKVHVLTLRQCDLGI